MHNKYYILLITCLIVAILMFYNTKEYKFKKKYDTNYKLVELRLFSKNFINYLKQICSSNGVKNKDYYNSLTRLINTYDDNRLYENKNVSDKSKTSYTTDKGKIIKLCLDVDINILKHVLLHEMAHIMCESIGHTKEFWEKFKYLSIKANECGLYQLVDFKYSPQNYCGTRIKFNPVYDYNG